MWIKEIIIEGFKSYATRTVITNLDPEFNAVTGLNGSGKSNILDAILFCLGLSKEYDTLRIKKLQELIYKNGAAGITKAEVTIVFDNRNKEQSPLGYQDCEKLVVTRQITSDKSKYFINGKSETQKNFKSMFRSVQLNIDNPHFLVAQGRITKIINLKPQELISMLEETAGTSLYNEKKREAQKLIQKKEEKLKQVNEIIEQEIQPQMQKLIEERHIFQLWRAQESEIQNLKRQLHTHEYYCKAKTHRMKKADQQLIKDSIVALEDKRKQEEIQLRNLEELFEKKKQETKETSLDQIQQEHKELTSLISRVEKNLQNQKKTKETIDNDKIKLEHTVRTLEADMERIAQKKEFSTKTLNQSKEELQEKKDLVDELIRQKQQSKSTSKEDATQIIQKQVIDTQSYLHSHQGDLDQVQERLKRIDDKMESSKKLFETSQKESVNLDQRINLLKQEIVQIEKQLEGQMTIENEIQFLKQQRSEIDHNILEVKNRLSQQPSYFSLNLSRMVDWNQKKVYGKVFSLFDIKDENFLKALEYGAGGKLNNIIVEDADTSAYMLNKNVLNQFAYFIPNKEINYIEINDDLIRTANQIAQDFGGFAKPATQLIQYDSKIDRAMKFVFGNFMVASSLEIANKIAYHPNNTKRFKVVTKEGDIVDPSGTITGGYSNEKNLILPKQRQYKKIQLELVEEEKKLESVEKKLKAKYQDNEYNEQLRQSLSEKKYQLEQFQLKQKRSSTFQFQTDQQKLENEKKDLLNEIERLQQNIKQTENKLKSLIQDQKQMSNVQDASQLIQQQIDRNKKEIDKLKQSIDKYKEDVQSQEVDLESCQQEITKCQKKIQEEQQNLNKSEEAINKLNNDYIQIKDKLLKVTETKADLESKFQIYNTQIQRINEQLQERQRYRNQIVDQLTTNQQDLKKTERELHDLTQQLKSLEDNNEFIRVEKNELMQETLNEKHQFVLTFEYEKNKQTFQRLEHEQSRLGKTVNFKVEAMTEQVEKDYKQLQEKKSILENDKNMLLQNMGELDDKKIKTIEKCFLEVNKTFSNIFSSLLKNAQAQLSRFDGKSIEDGIEMVVSFSHQPKNLSELSGGQRSLLALSFILALLKYEPAPFYILDEVDSALDLSHTENIGQMLSQNFKQSQFLLISLKEGMYQNANVLYRVQFVDGVSKVERHEIKQKKQAKQIQS